jgi:hypothetical protein
VLLVEEVVDVQAGHLVLALGLELALLAHERLGDACELVVDLGGGLGLAGDDQRGSRLVDEDRVDLVDDRVGVASLGQSLERHGHVVAQVVEAELGVRAVGDVGRVSLLALRERHHVADEARAHAELLVDRAHPLGVALGEVVVDGDQVDTGAGERVQVQRHGCHERFPLTRLHLGDVSLVEDDRAHHLHVEVALTECPLGRFANGRECLEDQVVDRLAVVDPLPELRGLAGELGIGERLEIGLERGDVVGLVTQALEPPAFAEAKGFLDVRELRHSGYRVSIRFRVALSVYSGRTRTSQRSPSTRTARTT